MYKSDINSWGRSMIEMLGVLAIVGVLSVGGIVGFNKAMRTYQMTKAATEYSEFIRDLMQFREALQKAVRLKGQNGVNVGLTSVISEIGIMPKKWVNRNGYIVDSTLHTTTVTSNGFNFTINYELKNKNPIAWNGNIEEYCRLLFTYVIIPYQDVLYTVWVHRYGEGEGTGTTGRFYGTNYCMKGRKCLNNATVTGIQKFCETCLDYENCTLVLSFK